MNDVAHISFSGGGIVVPSNTPYARELMVQHVENATKRFGNVRLLVDKEDWAIRISSAVCAACTRCKEYPKSLTYRLRGLTICRRCAHRALH